MEFVGDTLTSNRKISFENVNITQLVTVHRKQSQSGYSPPSHPLHFYSPENLAIFPHAFTTFAPQIHFYYYIFAQSG